MKNTLLLGTNNQGKVREYRDLLKDIPYEMVTPGDCGIKTGVEEGGETFEENAILKATTYAAASGLLSLADDSGLEVDILNGEPGTHSHRFAGENATDEDRVSLLLAKLKGIPEIQRSAQFRCVIAIAAPDGRVDLCSGICQGFITTGRKGRNGFGYDPVFYIPALRKTMAELTLEQKNSISHRAQAAAQARDMLLQYRPAADV